MSKGLRRDPPEAGSLAFSFVALVLVFMGVGYVADRWLSTGPWLMVGGVFVGAGLGFVYLVFILLTTSSRGRGRRDKDSNGGTGGRS
jgi:F0F1-type ATP synthase assembly protein I